MARVARPVDPEWWDSRNGEYDHRHLYHGTSWPRAQQILREGLIPWNQQEADYHPSNYGSEFESDWHEPRPDHVYMAESTAMAQEHARHAKDPITGDPEHGVVLKIDPRHLDPKLINPDEDTHPQPHQEDWYDTPEWEQEPWMSRGQMAEDLGYGDDPSETAAAIDKHGLIGYRGTIPPEAISVHQLRPNRLAQTPLPELDEQGAPIVPTAPQVPAGQGYWNSQGAEQFPTSKVSTQLDPLDELQAFLQGQGQAPEAVAPSVHHNSELDFVSEPVVSPLQAASPYPPGHEPKPVSDGPGGLSAGPTQKPSLLSKVKGWFKRAEALEEPQNSLNWRGYGTPGKGLYYNDTGQVFTWPVSGPDLVPHHLDMHQEFRPDLRIKEQDFLRAGHVPFNISPLGRIDNSWDPDGVVHPNAVAAINQADSRLQVGDINNEGGFGHARGIMDRLDGYYGSSDDELHYSLEIPEDIKHRIKAWVDDQNWPEDTDFEDPDDYHITLLYSKDGHDEHGDADWLYETDGYDVKVVGIDEFGDEAKKAVVLRIKCDELLDHANDLLDAAENRGLDVSRFPGGYKPHLTVAYAFGKPPYARYPKLKFKTGPSATSEPREGSIQHSACGCIVPCTCPDKENTTGGWLRSAVTEDPYMCRTCLKPTLAEPRPIDGDWRWLQTCTNCGRSTSISPTHPVVQAIKNAQPQYPALLDEVARPRPLGEWMARTAAHGLGPCPDCGGDITTNNSPTRYYHPGAQEPYACSNCGKLFTDSQARMTMPPGPNCPKCNSEMQWRDSSSLGRLYPKGAWECLNQRCWHMAEPGELAPDTVPNEMTNDWRPEGWDDETEHPLGPHTGSRVAMPADPDWWQEWSKRGPLYHTTLESNLPSILSEGLRPASDLGNARYDNWFTPRPGHTYLTGDIERAHDHAKNAPGADDGNHVMLAIDPSHLDPQHINPDEDWMMDHNTLPDNEYEQIVQRAAPDWQIGQGLTNAWPEGLGQTAERVGLGDDPAHTQHGIEDMNSIAYRGTIPPEAIRQLHYDPEREDYFDDPVSHVASTRQSAVRSWEKGRWGHGLLDSNDEVHVWNSEPERDDQIASLLDENPQARFLVNPAGGFLLQGGRKDRDGVMDYISQAHPDLWPMPQLQAGPGGLEDMGDGDQVL